MSSPDVNRHAIMTHL